MARACVLLNNGRVLGGKSIYVMWGLIIVSDSGGQMAPPDGRSQAIVNRWSHSSKYVNGQTKSGIADHLGSSAGSVPVLCEFMRVQLLVGGTFGTYPDRLPAASPTTTTGFLHGCLSFSVECQIVFGNRPRLFSPVLPSCAVWSWKPEARTDTEVLAAVKMGKHLLCDNFLFYLSHKYFPVPCIFTFNSVCNNSLLAPDRFFWEADSRSAC
jgi:hypothetical protein